MSNTIIENLVKEKDYIFKRRLFTIISKFQLNVFELLLLIYFLNQEQVVFEVKAIKEVTLMSESDIMEAFSGLITKKLINLQVVKDDNGKVNEVIDLGTIYQTMVSDMNENQKQQEVENIFNTFEKEFGRPLTPMEYEIINAWLKSGTNEELIIGALKEATFNGVSSLRYIDKIIYEWGKKGFKNMNDVSKHLKTPTKSESKELFDYNWLDED